MGRRTAADPDFFMPTAHPASAAARAAAANAGGASSAAPPAAAALASAVAATAAASADLTDADRSCVVCMDAPREVRFDPCSHAALQHVKTPSGATAPWQGLALGCAKHSGRAV